MVERGVAADQSEELSPPQLPSTMCTGPQGDQPPTVPPASSEEALGVAAIRGGSVGGGGGGGEGGGSGRAGGDDEVEVVVAAAKAGEGPGTESAASGCQPQSQPQPQRKQQQQQQQQPLLQIQQQQPQSQQQQQYHHHQQQHYTHPYSPGSHNQRAMVGGDHYAGELTRAMQYAEHAYLQPHHVHPHPHHPNSPYYHPHSPHHHHHHSPHHPLSPSLTYYPAPYLYQVVYQDNGPAYQFDKGGVDHIGNSNQKDVHAHSAVGHGANFQGEAHYVAGSPVVNGIPAAYDTHHQHLMQQDQAASAIARPQQRPAWLDLSSHVHTHMHYHAGDLLFSPPTTSPANHHHYNNNSNNIFHHNNIPLSPGLRPGPRVAFSPRTRRAGSKGQRGGGNSSTNNNTHGYVFSPSSVSSSGSSGSSSVMSAPGVSPPLTLVEWDSPLMRAGVGEKEDIDVVPEGARFFVIKSYSEDDIHKSIKYGVWSSTASGNRRLDAAFRACAHAGADVDASSADPTTTTTTPIATSIPDTSAKDTTITRPSSTPGIDTTITTPVAPSQLAPSPPFPQPQQGEDQSQQDQQIAPPPVILFFSVNASGQFCGVAQMMSAVNFEESLDHWQQDKWSGHFSIKWLAVKDVPNTQFRHITLENNDNKPITNSRDTQEVPRPHALSFLSSFTTHPASASVLDDWAFYETRERAMRDRRRARVAVAVASKQADAAVEDGEDGDKEGGEVESVAREKMAQQLMVDGGEGEDAGAGVNAGAEVLVIES